jgi:Phage integrase family
MQHGRFLRTAPATIADHALYRCTHLAAAPTSPPCRPRDAGYETTATRSVQWVISDEQTWVISGERRSGKGDKWRTCPLWRETADHLRRLVERPHREAGPEEPVFCSSRGTALTRFGLYKIVRRHATRFDAAPGARGRRVTPHVFRHTAAVHLLEAGVEVNVIRGWLGHVSLDTTNRYAEISLRTKAAALDTCTAPVRAEGNTPKPPWHANSTLMDWLDSL